MLKEIGLHTQNMITIVGSIANIIWGGGALHEKRENLPFDNE
jgi:hypothetical protein